MFELLEQGVDTCERETFEGALKLGEAALKQLGVSGWRAKQTAHHFRAHDEETNHELYQHYHDDIDIRARISASAREQIRETMQSDEDHITEEPDKDWR